MREVIRKLVDAENEARQTVEAARIEAEAIVSEARRQASERLAQARRDARAESQHVVETATRDALKEKQDRLSRATADLEAGIDVDGARRECLVQAAVRCVCAHP